jgi:hypothetical protein
MGTAIPRWACFARLSLYDGEILGHDLAFAVRPVAVAILT